MRQRAAIDADDQIMARAQLGHSRLVWAIAFVDAVGDIQGCAQPQCAQIDDQQRGGRAAIHIIIGKNGDALARVNGSQKSRRRLIHIF